MEERMGGGLGGDGAKKKGGGGKKVETEVGESGGKEGDNEMLTRGTGLLPSLPWLIG